MAGFINDELAELYKRAPLRLTNYGGTAQAITADGDPVDITATGGLVDGMLVLLVAQADNSAVDPTLAIDSETARAIKDALGNNIPEGRIRSGFPYVLKYDLANTAFRIVVDGAANGQALVHGAPVLKTIAAGVIDATSLSFVAADTEASAATDDLDTINGGVNGQELIVVPASGARTVVLKDGTGNLRLSGDFSLDTNQDTIRLLFRSNLSAWVELSRSDNAA